MNAILIKQQADAHYRNGDIRSAVTLLQQLHAAGEINADLSGNIGYLLYLLGDLAAAETFLQQALTLDARHAPSLSNLGLVLQALRRPEEAEKCYREAILHAPQKPEARCNLAALLLTRGAVYEAIAHLHAALQLNPQLPDTWCNLAVAWQDIAETRKAFQCFEHARQLAPQRAELLSNSLMATLYEPEMNSAAMCDAAALCRTEPANSYCAATPHPDARLRIGMLSADFRSHPVGNMLRNLLPQLIQQGVEICLYSTGLQHDEVTTQLRDAGIHTWRDIVGFTPTQLCDTLRGDHLHVMVDLAGHSAGSRWAALQQRFAPLQINWLGYPGAVGWHNCDFTLMGKDLLASGAQAFFPERVVALPTTHFLFTPPDCAPSVAATPALHNGFITFGSFNNTAKVNLHTIGLWSRVLHAIPDSRLIIKWKTCADATYTHHLRTAFAIEGIDPLRIELRNQSTHPDMLAEYCDVDIALDTWPFTGGMTTLEALWMGVPVVSLYSLRPVSRQGLSVLNALSLDKLACRTASAYVAAAVTLASDIPALQELRAGLRERIQQSSLMNYADFATAFVKVVREQLHIQ